MPFELPRLPYAYDALQPVMSKETLEYHHDKHHATYVETANKLIEGSSLAGKPLEEVVRASHRAVDKKLFNNAAQHWNHLQFWLGMTPKGGGKIPGELEKRLTADLGGVEKFKKDFVAEGVSDFGSGWVWLVVDDGGKLEILKTANAENPLVLGKTMLAVCDVWEHAYYIDYRNKREAFLKAFVDHLINWEYAAELYANAPTSDRAAA